MSSGEKYEKKAEKRVGKFAKKQKERGKIKEYCR